MEQELNAPDSPDPRRPSGHASYRHYLYLFLILILGAGLRFGALGQESLWADEYHSLINASQPDWRAVCASAWNQGVQAPYFLILHAWIRVAGQSDLALRLPSAIFGLFSIFLMYRWGLLIFRKSATQALLAAALLALSPMHVWYSQEARPYALQIMVELCALLALTRGLAEKETSGKNTSWLAVSAVLAILALEIHHFSIFIWAVFLVIYALAFWRGRLSRNVAWALMALMIAGAIHPMLGIINRLGPRSELQSFLPASYTPAVFIDVLRAQFLGPHWSPLPFWLQVLGIVIGGYLLFHGAWRMIHCRETHQPIAMIPVIGWLMTLALPTAISLYRPVIFYGQRYLIIAIPFSMMLLIANWIDKQGSPRRIVRHLHRLAWLILIILQVSYFRPYYTWKQKHLWNQVGAVIDRQRQPGDRVFVTPERNAGLLAHYMSANADVRGIPMDPNALRQVLSENLSGIIYIVGYNNLQQFQPWLAAQGIQRNLRIGIFETHQPGQILWINEFRKP